MLATFQHIWFYWLLFILLSWLAIEIVSIALDHWKTAYTLSDTIRHWSSARPWLALIVIMVTSFLIWHFFVEA